MIAAERRRQIHEWAMQKGSVTSTWLAEVLGVRAATIRHDLDVLHKEGLLIRSHGGAIAKTLGPSRLPYSQTRGSYLTEKAMIGEAALAFMPPSGTIFIGSGSTTYQMAIKMSENRGMHVVTNALEVALHLAAHLNMDVDVLGGKLRPETCTTSCLHDPAFEMLYWDVTFIGLPAVNVPRGLSTIDGDAAMCTRKVIEHSSKVVLLCDSSKFGRFSYAKIGPVSLVDTVITDSGVDSETIKGLNEQGVEVIVAGMSGNGHAPGSNGGNGHHSKEDF